MKKILLVSLLFFIVDQAVKFLITSFIELNNSIEIIGNFFSLTYVENHGAAFGILSGNRLFLIVVALFTMYLIYESFIKNKVLNKINFFAVSILLGGIVGNLFDRVMYGYVIDFLDFKLYNYNFPVFNLADTFIVLSTLVLVINMLGEKNEEDSSRK